MKIGRTNPLNSIDQQEDHSQDGLSSTAISFCLGKLVSFVEIQCSHSAPSRTSMQRLMKEMRSPNPQKAAENINQRPAQESTRIVGQDLSRRGRRRRQPAGCRRYLDAFWVYLTIRNKWIARSLRGWRVGVKTPLSPCWGWIISYLYPRLTSWALFFRRVAARNRLTCFTLNLQNEISRAHTEARPFCAPRPLRPKPCPFKTSASDRCD